MGLWWYTMFVQTIRLHLCTQMKQQCQEKNRIRKHYFYQSWVCVWILKGQDAKVILLWLHSWMKKHQKDQFLLHCQCCFHKLEEVTMRSGRTCWCQFVSNDHSNETGVLQNIKWHHYNHPDLWGFNTNASVSQKGHSL